MEIKTKKTNNKQIVATIDEDDNSVDIAVLIDGNPDVTFNIAVDDEKITMRKWLGYGDSIDDYIYLSELECFEEDDDEEEEY